MLTSLWVAVGLAIVITTGCSVVWEGQDFTFISADTVSHPTIACNQENKLQCRAPSAAPAIVEISPDAHIISAEELNYRVAALSPKAALLLAERAQYTAIIKQAAQQHAIDLALIYAVIHAESAFNQQAVSPVGAQGLMQLMPDTAVLMNVENPFNPAQNIAGGVRYLRLLLDQFEDHQLALAAYNAGPGNVIRFERTIPPFAETRQYIERVSRLYQGYRRELDRQNGHFRTKAIADSLHARS